MIANNPNLTEYASILIDQLWTDRLALLSVDDIIDDLYQLLLDVNDYVIGKGDNCN